MSTLLQRFKKELQRQYTRYKQHKMQRLIGLMLMCLIFTMTPFVLKKLVPMLLGILSQRMTYVFIISLTTILVISVYNIGIYFVYLAKHPFFEQYRAHPDKPWPWEVNSQVFKSELRHVVAEQAVNMLVVIPILTYLQAYFKLKKVDINMANTPSTLNMVPQLIIIILLEDFFFFSTHWILHSNTLYKYHKDHHVDQATTTLSAFKGHVIENLTQIAIPSIIYLKVAELYAPMHITTLVIWLTFRYCEGNNAHSGYHFPFHMLGVLPFAAGEDYHEFHHSRNVGNFGNMFRFWDTIFDTNKWYYQQKETAKVRAKMEMEKKIQ